MIIDSYIFYVKYELFFFGGGGDDLMILYFYYLILLLGNMSIILNVKICKYI